MKHLHLPILCGLALLAGCSSLSRPDPEKAENLTIDYGAKDLKTLAGGMATSLVADPALNYFEHSSKDSGDPRIVVYMGGVENRTSEHIDTQSITDSIRTALVQSGKFRLTTSAAGQDEIEGQVRFQQGSGRVDPETAKAFGRQVGADVVILGRLVSLEQTKGRSIETLGAKTEDVYYKFTLECVGIESGEVLWMNEQDVLKRQVTGILG